MDDFLQELALGQARLLEKVIGVSKEQSTFEENGLFPKSMEGTRAVADAQLES